MREGQQLIAHTAELALDRQREIAARRGGEDRVERAFQRRLSAMTAALRPAMP